MAKDPIVEEVRRIRQQYAARFNLDSAVAIDRKREPQPFRSEVDGFLPLSRHRSTVLGDDTKPHGNDMRERKNHFETSQSDAFAASGFRLAPDIFGLTAESGFNYDLAAIFRDLKERQHRGEFNVVSRKPRRPVVKPPTQKRRAV